MSVLIEGGVYVEERLVLFVGERLQCLIQLHLLRLDGRVRGRERLVQTCSANTCPLVNLFRSARLQQVVLFLVLTYRLKTCIT